MSQQSQNPDDNFFDDLLPPTSNSQQGSGTRAQQQAQAQAQQRLQQQQQQQQQRMQPQQQAQQATGQPLQYFNPAQALQQLQQLSQAGAINQVVLNQLRQQGVITPAQHASLLQQNNAVLALRNKQVQQQAQALHQQAQQQQQQQQQRQQQQQQQLRNAQGMNAAATVVKGSMQDYFDQFHRVKASVAATETQISQLRQKLMDPSSLTPDEQQHLTHMLQQNEANLPQLVTQQNQLAALLARFQQQQQQQVQQQQQQQQQAANIAAAQQRANAQQQQLAMAQGSPNLSQSAPKQSTKPNTTPQLSSATPGTTTTSASNPPAQNTITTTASNASMPQYGGLGLSHNPTLSNKVFSTTPTHGLMTQPMATSATTSTFFQQQQQQHQGTYSIPTHFKKPQLTDEDRLKHLLKESSTQPILSKRKIQDLVSQIDSQERLDPEVEEMLIDIADDFIEQVTEFACKLAKHRGVDALEVRDLQLPLEKHWNIRVPGYTDDLSRLLRRNTASYHPAHKERLNAVKKAVKEESMLRLEKPYSKKPVARD